MSRERTIDELAAAAMRQRRAWNEKDNWSGNVCDEAFVVSNYEYSLILHHLPPLWVSVDNHDQLRACGMKIQIQKGQQK
jgi:hypothetical protein